MLTSVFTGVHSMGSSRYAGGRTAGCGEPDRAEPDVMHERAAAVFERHLAGHGRRRLGRRRTSRPTGPQRITPRHERTRDVESKLALLARRHIAADGDASDFAAVATDDQHGARVRRA